MAEKINKKMRKKYLMKAMPTGRQGFTLVELLIVIALISILSVAVLATINPIEQANKARDASMQNDAAEVLNAYERMYANNQQYPWMAFGATKLAVGASMVVSSKMLGFGICYGDSTAEYTDVGACNTSNSDNQYGLLITADELKPSFAGKKPFQSANLSDELWAVKDSGAGGSIRVCYVPSAKSNQIMTTRLKCLDDDAVAVIDNGVGDCAAPAAGDEAFNSATTDDTAAVWRCVPEADVALPTAGAATPTP